MRERIFSLRILLFLLIIITTGTVGYIIIEKWSFIDSLYMTIITISTVGYSEVHALSNAGKLLVNRIFKESIWTSHLVILNYSIN